MTRLKWGSGGSGFHVVNTRRSSKNTARSSRRCFRCKAMIKKGSRIGFAVKDGRWAPVHPQCAKKVQA